MAPVTRKKVLPKVEDCNSESEDSYKGKVEDTDDDEYDSSAAKKQKLNKKRSVGSLQDVEERNSETKAATATTQTQTQKRKRVRTEQTRARENERRRLLRQNETPEARRKRNDRVKARRRNETPEQRLRRLKTTNDRRRKQYHERKSNETQEEYEERVRRETDIRWFLRHQETDEQRERRLIKDKERQRRRRNQLGYTSMDAESRYSTSFRLGRVCQKVPCPVCALELFEENLETHMIRHLGQDSRPFKCSVCSKSFLTFVQLKDHRLNHFDLIPFEENNFYCDLCSSIIFTRRRFINHLKYHRRTTGLHISDDEPIYIYLCDYDGCGICFRNKGRFESHLESHYPTRVAFRCNNCEKPFAKESNLKIHLESIHENRDGAEEDATCLQCTYCHLVVAKKDYENHEKTHILKLNEPAPGNHLCESCGKTYKNAKSLEIHFRRAHTAGPWEHTPAQRGFSSYHEQRARNGSSCMVCYKYIKGRKEKINHMLREHTYEHGTECYECGRKFEYLHTLLNHIRRTHTKEPTLTKRAFCKYCPMSFSGYMAKHKHHYFIHEEEYLKDGPYVCLICYNHFKTEELRDKHLAVHEKFKCPVESCLRYLISKVSFDIHLRTHNLGPLATGVEGTGKYMSYFKKNNVSASWTRQYREATNKYLPSYLRTCPDQSNTNEVVEDSNTCTETNTPNASDTMTDNSNPAEAMYPIATISGPFPIASTEVTVFDNEAEPGQGQTVPLSDVSPVLRMHEVETIDPQVDQHQLIQLQTITETPVSLDITQQPLTENATPEQITVITIPKTQKQYICNQCPRQFKFPKHLALHLAWHKGDETGNKDLMKSSTQECEDFILTNDLDLEKFKNPNFKGVEKKLGIINCSLCSDIFSSVQTLNKHRRVIHGIFVTDFSHQYKCDQCPRTFSKRFNFARHVEVIHGSKIEEEEDEAEKNINENKNDNTPLENFKLNKNIFKDANEDVTSVNRDWFGYDEDNINSEVSNEDPYHIQSDVNDLEETHDADEHDIKPDIDELEGEVLAKRRKISEKRQHKKRNINSGANADLDPPDNFSLILVSSKADHKNKFKCDSCSLSFTRESTLLQHSKRHAYPEEILGDLPESPCSAVKSEPEDYDYGDGDADDPDWYDDGNVDNADFINHFEDKNEECYKSILKSKVKSLTKPPLVKPRVKRKTNSLDFEPLPATLPNVFQLKLRLKKCIDKLSKKLKRKTLELPPSYVKLNKINLDEVAGDAEVLEIKIEPGVKVKLSNKRIKEKQLKEATRVHRKRNRKTEKIMNDDDERKSSKPKRIIMNRIPTELKVKCKICLKLLHPRTDMKAHLATHDPTFKPYQCPSCSQKFANRNVLRTHKKAVHPELIILNPEPKMRRPRRRTEFENGEYYCDFCFINLKYKRRFDRHMRTHFEDEPLLKTSILDIYHCDVCNLGFRKEKYTQFRIHLETHDESKTAHVCSACDKPFAAKENLENHILGVHSGKIEPGEDGAINPAKVYDCPYCFRFFKDIEEWKKHDGVHRVDLTSTLTGEHMCSVCGRVFAHIESMNGHCVQEHGGEGVDPSVRARVRLRKDQGGTVSHNDKDTCKICGEVYGVRSALNNHYLKAHTYQHGLYCYICGRKFSCLSPLLKHLESYHKDPKHLPLPPKKTRRNPKKKFHCSVCSVVYNENYRLDKHMFNNHQEIYLADKPFYCKLCFKNFVTEAEVVEHLPVHDEFKCTHCGKQFFRKDYFNVHLMQHTGERPFGCDKCDRRFTTVFNLRDHQKRQHSATPAERFSFFCDKCPVERGFDRRVHLRNHEKNVHGVGKDPKAHYPTRRKRGRKPKIQQKILYVQEEDEDDEVEQDEFELELEMVHENEEDETSREYSDTDGSYDQPLQQQIASIQTSNQSQHQIQILQQQQHQQLQPEYFRIIQPPINLTGHPNHSSLQLIERFQVPSQQLNPQEAMQYAMESFYM